MTPRVWILALTIANVPAATAEEPPKEPLSLSLDQAFARALEANLALGRARAEVGAAEATKRGAFSAILPRITASGSLVRNDREVAFGSGASARTILPENDWSTRFTLSQPIFAGLRDLKFYEQAKIGIDSARSGVRGSENQVLLAVAGDYLAVVQAEALLVVEQQNLALAERRRRQAVDLFEAGESTRVDVLRADTAIKASERRVSSAKLARETAVGRLRIDLALDDDLAVSDPGSVAPPPPSEATLIERAEANRPEVDLAKMGVEIAGLEVAKQKGAYLPVVTADAGYVYQKTAFPSDRYAYAAVRLNLPLFQGGEIGARVALARERERQAQLGFAEVRRVVREEVHKTCLDLATAETNLALAREQLASAEAEYQQMFELYQSQETTALDLQAAEISLSEARRAVTTGRFDKALAELRVWFAAGLLKQAVFKEVVP